MLSFIVHSDPMQVIQMDQEIRLISYGAVRTEDLLKTFQK